MCKILEDMRNEAAHKAAYEAARKAAHDKAKEKAILMLKKEKISFEEVPDFFSELSDEDIEEIKSKVFSLV